MNGMIFSLYRMAPTSKNAEKCKRWRDKQNSLFKRKEKVRVKKYRIPMKDRDPAEQDKIRARARISMAKMRQKKKLIAASAETLAATNSSNPPVSSPTTSTIEAPTEARPTLTVKMNFKDHSRKRVNRQVSALKRRLEKKERDAAELQRKVWRMEKERARSATIKTPVAAASVPPIASTPCPVADASSPVSSAKRILRDNEISPRQAPDIAVVDREFVCCIFYSSICYIVYGGCAHCSNARAQWQLPRCPIFELFWHGTCFAGWRDADLVRSIDVMGVRPESR